MSKSAHVAVSTFHTPVNQAVESAFESPNSAFHTPKGRALLPEFDAAAEQGSLSDTDDDISECTMTMSEDEAEFNYIQHCRELEDLLADENADDFLEFFDAFDRRTPVTGNAPRRVVPTATSGTGTVEDPIVID